MQLRYYQKDIVEGVHNYIRKGVKKICVIATTASGKAQPLESKVLTPSGFVEMGSLSVGDSITGSDGKIHFVTGIYPQGIKPVYKVTMSDGSSTECCSDHLWNVTTSYDKQKNKPYKTLSLKEIKETYVSSIINYYTKETNKRFNYFIPIVKPIEFNSLDSLLPLDSYSLGLLLGDGSFVHGRIHFSSPDLELQEYLRDNIPSECSFKLIHESSDIDFSITTKRGLRNPVLDVIRELGLGGKSSNSKFIPSIYKYSSISNRINILQGLFDTDGTPSGSGNVEFCTVSKQLSEDVTFLVQSLGGVVKVSTKYPTYTYKGEKRIGQLAYRMSVKLPINISPFRLTRKLEKYNLSQQTKYTARRSIVNVEYVGEKECQCISVSSPDNLYVTDDFIVTHNTIVSSKLTTDFINKNLSVLFVVDRDNLVSQTADKFNKFNLEFGFIKAGYQESRNSQIQIASVQTMSRRDWWKNKHFDIVFLDECHELAYHQTIQEMMIDNPNIIFIGLTATPYRLSSKQELGDIFEKSVCSPPPKVLMDEGSLTPLIYYGLTQADLTKARTEKGDYKKADLKIVCDTPDMVSKAVEEWFNKTPGMRTIAFCVDKEHAKNVMLEFRKNNVPSVSITDETKKEEREYYYKCLREGGLKVISSVDVLSKGFDEPSVEVGLLLRPTKSRAMHEQQIGRVMRLCPEIGKTHGVILDQAGNTIRHGFIEDIKQYRLRRSDEKNNEDNPTPLKQCPSCESLLYGFQMTCPNCGFVFTPLEAPVLSGNLELLFNDFKQESAYKYFKHCRKVAFESIYHPQWADKQTCLKFDMRGIPRIWYQNSVFKVCDTKSVTAYYRYLKQVGVKGGREWSIKDKVNWMDKEFGKDVWKDKLLTTPELKERFEREYLTRK